MTLEQQFQKAQSDSQLLTERPDNTTLLRLYALFKQGTYGNAPTEGPNNPFDIVGKAKYQAWSELADTPKEMAQQQYIALVQSLQ